MHLPSLCLLMVGSLAAQTPIPNPSVIHPDHWVVLKGKEARSLTDQCSRIGVVGVTDLWQPSDSDVQRLMGALPAFVQGQSPSLGNEVAHYNFQVAGFVANGERIIYVNAFRDSVFRARDWHSKAVLPCDGGSLFWGVEYIPSKKQFRKLSTNGAL